MNGEKCTICKLTEEQHQGGYDRHVFTTEPRRRNYFDDSSRKIEPEPRRFTDFQQKIGGAVFQIGLILGGLALVGFDTGWLTAAGVFLIVWGNNK